VEKSLTYLTKVYKYRQEKRLVLKKAPELGDVSHWGKDGPIKEQHT